MSAGQFTVVRGPIPNTDEFEFEVRYTASMKARVAVEAIIDGGREMVECLVSDMEHDLTVSIRKELGESDATASHPVG